MTFTDQNFTRLPFSNIRQPVLSLGPICHLGWAPELAEEKKNVQMETMCSQEKKKGSCFSDVIPAGFFSQGISTTVRELCRIRPASHSEWETFTPTPFHPPPPPICLKSTLCRTRPTLSPAAIIRSKPATPTSRLLHPLLYGSMSKSIHIGVLCDWDCYRILSQSVKCSE